VRPINRTDRVWTTCHYTAANFASVRCFQRILGGSMRSAALGFIDGRPLTVRLTRRARCRPRQFFPPEPKSTDCRFGHGSWQRVHFHLAGGYPGVTVPDTVTTGPIIGVRSVAVIRVIVRPGRECTANDRTGNDVRSIKKSRKRLSIWISTIWSDSRKWS
jgi:hypothetical protein